jgi:hypothetical protein
VMRMFGFKRCSGSRAEMLPRYWPSPTSDVKWLRARSIRDRRARSRRPGTRGPRGTARPPAPHARRGRGPASLRRVRVPGGLDHGAAQAGTLKVVGGEIVGGEHPPCMSAMCADDEVGDRDAGPVEVAVVVERRARGIELTEEQAGRGGRLALDADERGTRCGEPARGCYQTRRRAETQGTPEIAPRARAYV